MNINVLFVKYMCFFPISPDDEGHSFQYRFSAELLNKSKEIHETNNFTYCKTCLFKISLIKSVALPMMKNTLISLRM